MISKCANLVTNYCIKKRVINTEEKEIYIYGFELVISFIVNFIWITLIGVAFNQLFLSYTAFLIFFTVRTQSGGYHADTYLKCNFVMIIVFTIILFLTTHIRIMLMNRSFFVLILLYMPIFMWVFAPLSTIQNPIKTEERRRSVRRAVLLRTVLWELLAVAGWAAGWEQITILVITTLGMVCILLVIEMERRKKGED